MTNFSVDLLLYFSAAPYARFMAIESSLAAGGSVAKSRVPDRVGENVPITAGNPKAAWSRRISRSAYCPHDLVYNIGRFKTTIQTEPKSDVSPTPFLAISG